MIAFGFGFGFGKPVRLDVFGFHSIGSESSENESNALFLATNLKTYLLFKSKALDYSKSQEVGLGMNFIT